MLFENVKKELTPVREKARELENNMDYVVDVLKRGAAACREIADATMDEVHATMGLYPSR